MKQRYLYLRLVDPKPVLVVVVDENRTADAELPSPASS